MASQQVLFAETIAGMKKAFKRKAYGKLSSGDFSRGSTLTANVPGRVRLGFRNRKPRQSRQQDEEAGEVRAQGSIGADARAERIQRGRAVQLHCPRRRPRPIGRLTIAKAIDFVGVRKPILRRNPPLVDDEGYEIDSDDDMDRIEEAELAAAELNPYAHVRLERTSSPLGCPKARS